MATIPPIVRHMVVCDNVNSEEIPRTKLNVLGVIHTIRAKPDQTFPLRHPGLCVYLMLTGGVGTGEVQIRVVEADTGIDLFGSPAHRVTYPTARHEVANIIFPTGGL